MWSREAEPSNCFNLEILATRFPRVSNSYALPSSRPSVLVNKHQLSKSPSIFQVIFQRIVCPNGISSFYPRMLYLCFGYENSSQNQYVVRPAGETAVHSIWLNFLHFPFNLSSAHFINQQIFYRFFLIKIICLFELLRARFVWLFSQCYGYLSRNKFNCIGWRFAAFHSPSLPAYGWIAGHDDWWAATSLFVSIEAEPVHETTPW